MEIKHINILISKLSSQPKCLAGNCQQLQNLWVDGVTLHMERRDAIRPQNNLNGSNQDTHTGWNTTWRLEDL